jgi:hypothetical protein
MPSARTGLRRFDSLLWCRVAGNVFHHIYPMKYKNLEEVSTFKYIYKFLGRKPVSIHIVDCRDAGRGSFLQKDLQNKYYIVSSSFFISFRRPYRAKFLQNLTFMDLPKGIHINAEDTPM